MQEPENRKGLLNVIFQGKTWSLQMKTSRSFGFLPCVWATMGPAKVSYGCRRSPGSLPLTAELLATDKFGNKWNQHFYCVSH